MEEMIEVKMFNRKPSQLGLVTGHKLQPGGGKAQTVKMTRKQYEMLLNDKTFKSWQKLNWCGIVHEHSSPRKAALAEPEAPADADALRGLAAKEAIAMVKATDDMDLLVAWHEKEERKTVKASLEARMDELSDEEEEEENPEGVVDLDEDEEGLEDDEEDFEEEEDEEGEPEE